MQLETNNKMNWEKFKYLKVNQYTLNNLGSMKKLKGKLKCVGTNKNVITVNL
jgi:hypothetical protein